MLETVNPIAVSVVIPAHNAEAYIRRAVDSVCRQTRPADEIIVVDDGSTDVTADIVRTYGAAVRLIVQSNAGAAAARNTGIMAATGDWIAFLDADDEWLPQRLAVQTDILISCPQLVWVSGNAISCSCSENRQAPDVPPDSVRRHLNGKAFLDDYLVGFRKGIRGNTDTKLIRRDILIEAGLFDPSLTKAEDIDLWWKIAYRHPAIGFAAEPVAIYHRAAPQRLNPNQTGGRFYADLIARHLTAAEPFNRLDGFRPLAAHLLRGWMRSMLFYAQADDIRLILDEFNSLFPLGYRLWMRLLTSFPETTASICYGLSKIIRRFNLRRRVVPPPPKR